MRGCGGSALGLLCGAAAEPCDGSAEDVADYVAAGWTCERTETSSEACEHWNANGSEKNIDEYA